MKPYSRLLLAIALLLASSAISALPGGNLRLLPDYEISNSISLDSNDPSRRFRVVIPDDVFEVHISLRDSEADLDLYLYDDYGNVFAYSEDSLYNEELILNRLSRPSIYTGEYELEVIYQLSRPPVIGGTIADTIDFSLIMEFNRIPPAENVSLDRNYERILSIENAGIDMIQFRIPSSADSIRVDVFDTNADVDFALNPAESFADPYTALFSGSSFLANEHGVFDVSGISDRLYYLMVLPGVYEERDIPYKLRISTDPEPSRSIFSYPDLPTDAEGMRRNLLATVEVSTSNGGGSGCIISSDGYILTNHHVLLDERGEISDMIAIGLTLSERLPSSELFLAEALFWDEDRDLALLKITSGLYGQDLPADFALPYFEMGDVDELVLGEELIFLGYPNVGGLGSKATITLTKGVLSGFEDLGLGTMIKTDGEINYGNSGGAALTADFLLVGLPTQLNPDSGGKIAYIHSLDMIPGEWLEAVGLR